MLNRRSFVLNLGLAGLASTAMISQASAGIEIKGFDAERFKEAQNSGKPILVHVTAPWCGTCKIQKPIVAELVERPDFAKFFVFEVDFDTEKEILRTLDVRSQSTMIVWKGSDEVGREVGETDAAAIEELLRKAF